MKEGRMTRGGYAARTTVIN